MPSGYVSVKEAAELLNVSVHQVRNLIYAGELEADLVGTVWLISLADVERRRRLGIQLGRALSPKMSWLVLRAFNDPESIYEIEHGEVRRRVVEYAKRPFEEQAPLLRRRADIARYYIHPGMISGVAIDWEIKEGGQRAASAYGAAVASDVHEFDLYLKRSEFEELVETLPNIEGARSNVRFHVVDDELWLFDRHDGAFVWPEIAVLDMYDRAARGLEEALLIWRGYET